MKNAVRLKLYNQGLVDREIAEKVGVTSGAIVQWRYTNNLPANGGGCGWGNSRSFGKWGSVPMEKALAPDQCEDMKHFLSSLIKYDGIAREAGKKLNLGLFMKEYRGVLRERAG